jgi:hypothetical protein
LKPVSSAKSRSRKDENPGKRAFFLPQKCEIQGNLLKLRLFFEHNGCVEASP